MRADRREVVRALLIILCAVLVITCGYFVARYFETRGQTESRGELTNELEIGKRVEYNGKQYKKRNALTSLLLIGVDKTESSASGGYRSGGQADFLLLAVIDPEAKTVRQLQIDRDCMANITVLSVLGKEVGTRNTQICLSHAFGKTEAENCAYTVKAVSSLLQGVDIDLYLSADISSINRLNDSLGGVTVLVEEDLTELDPALQAGKTVTLAGQQAELFVRQRHGISDGSNRERAKRQRAFMAAALDSIKRQSAGDSAFVTRLFDELQDYTDTNASKGRLINEMNAALKCEMYQVELLKGEYQRGSDGFIEFHPDETALMEWVLDVFYKQVQE